MSEINRPTTNVRQVPDVAPTQVQATWIFAAMCTRPWPGAIVFAVLAMAAAITIAACLFDTLNVDVGVAKAFGMSESGIKHKNLALVGNDSGCLLTACAVSFARNCAKGCAPRRR